MPRPKSWSPALKLTLEDYETYADLPAWAKDSPEFSTKDEYHQHWTRTIFDFLKQSKNDQGKWKDRCKQAQMDVESIEDSEPRSFGQEKSLAYKPIAIAYAHVQEKTALLAVNTPQGQVVATQEAQNNYVSALNTLLDAEFKENNVEAVKRAAIYEGQFYNLGWWKTSVDYNRYGPFGQKGKILIEDVDCDDMHVDPKSRGLSWDRADYFIHESEHEIGYIRQMYPISGFEISDTAESSAYTSMLDTRSQDTITSPLANLAKGPSGKRQRIKVLECWFKDSRLKFVPDLEDKETVGIDGLPMTEPRMPKLDEDGFVLGDWVPMYPRGRCLVVAEGTVLEDMPNRLPHGRCPFIPIPFCPRKKNFLTGDAVRIIVLVEKINDIISRIHEFGQSETSRSVQVENGSLTNPQHYKRLPNRPDKCILLNQGKTGTVNRPPAQEVPQFLWVLLDKYQQELDMIAGTSAVQRGTLSDGAQLSAEALTSLQQYASSRIALAAKCLAEAVKELTFQTSWLIRCVYDENITVQVSMPDGSSQALDWQSDKTTFESGTEEEIDDLISKESYMVDIKAGTGTPNAASARQSTADHLYDRKAIDRIALLDAYEYPDRKNIATRMDQKELQEISAEALGRKLGMGVTKIERDSDSGAKPKADAA